MLTTPAMAKIDEDSSWLLSSTAQVLGETLGLPASLCTHTACQRVRPLLPSWPIFLHHHKLLSLSKPSPLSASSQLHRQRTVQSAAAAPHLAHRPVGQMSARQSSWQ